MKKIYLFIIIAFIAMNGCYDLDRAPFDQLSSATFWKTEDQCKQGLMGVYATFKRTDLYGKQFLTDINSDVAVGYDQYEALILGTATPTTGFLNGKWQNGYNSIQGAIWQSGVFHPLKLMKTAKRCLLERLNSYVH